MVIKIDENLSAEKILKVVKNLLNKNQPIGENNALAITIVNIIDHTEVKNLSLNT